MVWLDVAVTPIVSQAVKSLAATKQGADVVLTWGTQSGVSYKMQTTSDLRAGWTDAPQISITLDGNAQTAIATDTGAAGGADKYYRVVCTLDAP